MSTKSNYKKRPAPDSRGPSKPKFGSSNGSSKFTPHGNSNSNSNSNWGAKGQFRPTKPQPGGGYKGKSTSASYPKAKFETKEAAVRRKRPVTQGGGSEVENEDDEGPSDDEMEVDYEEVPAEGEGQGANGGGEGEGEPAEKRPRMSKVERAALHAAQPHRTALLPSHPLLHGTLLPLWETARRADLGKEERKVAVKELWEAVKGRVGEVSRGHKGGRVLQTIVKHGGKDERLGVAMELQPQWREMMESKYSKFLMAKLIRYVPDLRPLLIPAITPHLLTLLSHAHAVQPLSDFFDLWASAKERRLLVRGFYPREVAIFDGGKGEEGLEGTLVGMGEGKGRERVLEGIEKTVLDVFNATQKTALAQGIFHRLVLEYLTCVYRFLSPEEADKKMHELLTASLESLPDIVHTKDGSAVVRELIVRGNAKDRKQILQPLRKHIEAMAKDSDAQLVLFTAFDCVDDTKLMGKAFVSDLIALIPTIAQDKNGRRAILYLLTPTSTRHFIPSTLATLAESAQKARELGTSKKDPATRRKELVGYASPGLLEVVVEQGEELVRDPGGGLLVQEIMLSAEGDKSKAVDTLVNPLRTPYPAGGEAEDETASDGAEIPSSHLLDLSHSTRTYKVLLGGGHFDPKTSSIHVTDSALSPLAAAKIWDALTSEEAGGEENVRNVARGNAAFVMVELIEALVKAGKGGEVKKVLGKKGLVEEVKAAEKKGSGLLAEKIAAL